MTSDKWFYDWYQKQLIDLCYDDASLIFLFGQFASGQSYSTEWAQNCLDFSYRVLKCNLCKMQSNNISDADILTDLANNSPSISDLKGYAVWSSYQLYATKEGILLSESCGLSIENREFSPLYKERVTDLFNKNGVGFDKSNFIPVQF